MSTPEDQAEAKKILDNATPEQLKAAARQIIINHFSDAMGSLREVLSFPGITPEAREESALFLAGAIVGLRDKIFKNNQSFEARELDVENVKKVLLGISL